MGQCLDLTSPGLELGVRCIPEHLYWDAVPEESLTALLSTSSKDDAVVAKTSSGCGGTIQKAQVETMRTALVGMTSEAHIIQHSAPFARIGAFMMASGGSVAVIGGRQTAKIAVTHSSLTQPDDDPSAEREVVRMQDFEARTGAAPRKRLAKGKGNDPNKKVKLKSDEQWTWEQSQQANESTITDLCKSHACSSHLVVSDICERIRSGRVKVETVPAPQMFHKSKDTAALFDGVLVIFSSHTASLTLFHLRAHPAADPCGVHLPWEACAMPRSPDDAPIPCLAAPQAKTAQNSGSKENEPVNAGQQAGPAGRAAATGDAPRSVAAGDGAAGGRLPAAVTANFYQNPQSNIGAGEPGGAVRPAPDVDESTAGAGRSRLWTAGDMEANKPSLGHASLHWNTCMVSSDSEHSLPSSSSCWSSMATDSTRNRFLVLQGSRTHKHWRLFEFVPKKPMQSSPDLPLMQACCRNYRFLSRPLPACSGRFISVRYNVEYTVVHAETLFAFVCPDASTAATQRPQAMRVYTLNLRTLKWALCSPRQEDGVTMAYPMPRIQAACTHQHGKVYMHGGSAVATGHGCLNDLWCFDLATKVWKQVPIVGSKQSVSSKLAAVRCAPVAACQHTLAIDSAGSVILQGGTQSRGETNRMLQIAVQLVNSVPGGVPTNIAMACRIRPAGMVAALALCRARIARAVLTVSKASAVICMRNAAAEQRVSAPIGVLQLYSGMLNDMVQDGVFDDALADPDAPAPVLPVNPRHDPCAVQTALRWVMGMCTMLPLDVHTCAEVLRVAEFFMMRSLRAEALCVICQKATRAHLPLLRDLQQTLSVPELTAVLQALQQGARGE
eukprot:jgi/Ulvmu1/7415/UM036_0075.1